MAKTRVLNTSNLLPDNRLLRVGLGFLLPLQDWSWWHYPEIIPELLRGLKYGSRQLKWGGDAQLEQPERWVDAARAASIISATRSLTRFYPAPLIQFQRNLWIWADTAALADLRADVMAVFPDGMHYFDWPTLRKPRRPEHTKSRQRTLTVTGTQALRGLAPILSAGLQTHWTNAASVSSILLTTSTDLIRAPFSDLVFLQEASLPAALSSLDQLRSLGARCVIRLDRDQVRTADWLRQFMITWRNNSTVEAAARANYVVGPFAEILAANATFLRRTASVIESRPTSYGRSARPRSAIPITELSSLISYQPANMPSNIAPSIPVARVMDACVIYADKQVELLPDSGHITIQLWIRYRALFDTGRPEFPDHRVDWTKSIRRLQVHMVALGREIVSGFLDLPRKGISSRANFTFLIDGGDIDIRFIVADGTRVVQTARFKGKAGRSFTFDVEVAHDNLEHDKQPFGLALLVNDSLGGRPSATALAPDGITITMLDSAEISTLRESLLSQIAILVKNPSIAPDATFYRLASKGRALLKGLQHYIQAWPAQLDRVQLTTQYDAYFPLEFFYDGPIPKNETASLCPQRQPCLKSGKALSPCAVREAKQHLCPMGFLGVTSIIERQTWTNDHPNVPWLSAPKDFDVRNRLSSLRAAAFAASPVADMYLNQNSGNATGVTTADVAQVVAPMINDWESWETAIQSGPSLLVLIPHIDNEQMYIGQNDSLSFGAVGLEHVGSGRPLVVAMGCSSAVAPVAIAGLPSIFLRCGAAVVIAALTEILGRHANVVTAEIVSALRQAAQDKQLTTVGYIVNATRRQMLEQNLAIGLVLVAFGDADFMLGGQ